MSRIWPHARSWTRRVPGEHPHPRLDGDRSPGRGPGRGCRKLSLFLFLLSPPPSISWDEHSKSAGMHSPGISKPLPSPCRLWCDRPHHGSPQPLSITLATALVPSSSRAVGKRGDLSSRTPFIFSPFPQPFSLPPCPDSEKKKKSAGSQVSTRLSLARLLRADDSDSRQRRHPWLRPCLALLPPGTTSATMVLALSKFTQSGWLPPHPPGLDLGSEWGQNREGEAGRE